MLAQNGTRGIAIGGIRALIPLAEIPIKIVVGGMERLDTAWAISKIRSSRTSVELASANAELGRAGGKWR